MANDSRNKYKHGLPDPVWVINAEDVASGGGVTAPVEVVGLVDDGNSHATPLGIGGFFEGTPIDVTDYAIFYVNVYSDVASAIDGLSVQQSSDGINWDSTDEYTVPASTGKTYSFQCALQWIRILYTNGGVGQAEFRLQTVFKGVYGKPSSHRIQDTIADEDDAELVKSVITGQNAAGKFVNFGASFPFPIRFGDESLDAFARQRVAEPHTIFDSKQIIDNNPLFWDDAQVSGAGTTSVHVANRATSDIGVSNLVAGIRRRQTFRRFNYEPGKSQLILATFSGFNAGVGITKIVGLGDDKNGLFLVNKEGTVNLRRRTFVTGAAVDNDDPQSTWNIDMLDGTGPSSITADWTKTQIFAFDLEWLGVGRVRFGFVIDGVFVPVHQLLNANNLATVYMSTPNLPLRYEIENDGNGALDTLGHICCSVISEGGTNSTGKLGYASMAELSINANTIGTLYSLLGVRLKTVAGCSCATVSIEKSSVLAVTNDDFEWCLVLNPTIAGGGLTWSDLTNYAVQIGLPDMVANPSTTTITGGTLMDGGYSKGGTSIEGLIDNALSMGVSILGIADEIVLAIRPRTSNMDAAGAVTFRELS